VPITVLAGGLLPREGTLHVKPETGNWEKIPLPQTQAEGLRATYAYEFQEVYQSFKYRIRIGDASSEEQEVTVVPPPRIVETVVQLRYPPYTGLANRKVDLLNLEVPEGTAIAWELHCDQALASAEMIRDEETRLPMALDPAGHVARIDATAGESFAYQFAWVEREHGYPYNEDIHYFVQVIPDTAPQIEILRPLEDEKATVQKTLTIAYQARDDYGLGDVAVVYSLNNADEQKRSLGPRKGRVIETEAEWKIRESMPSLKEGDVLTYTLEVADNHTGSDGPFRSRAQTRRLYIVSREEYLAYVNERRRKLIGEIRELHKQETEAADQVGEIEKQKAP